jgi:NADH-quinone oxidoreductase subunit J
VQAVPAGGNNPGYPRAIGFLLFKDYLLAFEVTSVLILIAIMGAVVLASPSKGAQEPLEQPPARRGED